ncbi:MAG: hypothetical protein R3D05_01350 [Dongiaceae bacterium]
MPDDFLVGRALEDELADERALRLIDAARVWVWQPRNRISGNQLRLVDAHASQVLPDVQHHLFQSPDSVREEVRLVRRIDRRRSVRSARQMTEEELDLFGRHASLAQLARHAVPDRIGRDALIEPGRFAREPPHMQNRSDGLLAVTHIAVAWSDGQFQPGEQGRRNRNDRSVFLVLGPVRRIEVEEAMTMIQLRRAQVQDGRGARKRVGCDQQKHHHVARAHGIEQSSKFFGRDRAASGLTAALRVGRQCSKDVRDTGDFLPLGSAIERGTPG